jgi:taurine dioxygenase
MATTIMATGLKEQAGVSVTKLHPVIGARIDGVDLSKPLDAATVEAIRDAWHEHIVLLFRGQEISGEDQLRFAAHFGAIAERHKPKEGATRVDSPEWVNLMPISNKKDESGKALGALGDGEMWFHTDKCYHEQPHRGSFLYGIDIPSEGGHTKFASLYRAYDMLPDELRRKLEGKRVMQGYDYAQNARLNRDVNLDNIFHFSQPIFVTNPGSGRKALYVSRLNSMWIEGMDRDESEAILQQLFDMIEDPSNYYEHVWQPGDLVMWDNLACLHARTRWPDHEARELRRCTTLGDALG